MRRWFWIARLIDPREATPAWRSMFTSLMFLPETLVLESSEPCFFRSFAGVPSHAVIVAGAEGSDSIDLAALAGQRAADAALALSLTRFSRYEVALLKYATDALEPEFAPGAEVFLQSGFGRCPPLTAPEADELRLWYQALRQARSQRSSNLAYAAALRRGCDAVLNKAGTRGVLMYAAFEDICQVLGGTKSALSTLHMSKSDRTAIERARRPHAHGGTKGQLEPHEQNENAQAVATTSFVKVLRSFLHSVAEHAA
jgi:hypothetical protein